MTNTTTTTDDDDEDQSSGNCLIRARLPRRRAWSMLISRVGWRTRSRFMARSACYAHGAQVLREQLNDV